MSNVTLKGLTRRIVPQDFDIPESSIDGFFTNPKSEQFKRGFVDENSVALTFSKQMEATQSFKKILHIIFYMMKN